MENSTVATNETDFFDENIGKPMDSILQTLDDDVPTLNGVSMDNSIVLTSQIDSVNESVDQPKVLDDNLPLWNGVLMENSKFSTNQTDSSDENIDIPIDLNTTSTTEIFTSPFKDKLNDAINLFNISMVQNSTCIQPILDSSFSLESTINNLNASIDDAISDLSGRVELTSIWDLFLTKPNIEFENGVKQNLTILLHDINATTQSLIDYLMHDTDFKSFEKHIFSNETGSARPILEQVLALNVSQVFTQDSECYQIANDIDKSLNETTMEFIYGLRDQCLATYARNTSSYVDDVSTALTEIFSMCEMTVGRLMRESLPKYEDITDTDLQGVSICLVKDFLLQISVILECFVHVRLKMCSTVLRMTSMSK